MARFVGLECEDGNIKFFNPDNVTAVFKDTKGCTIVDLLGDEFEITRGTPLEVATFLGEGRPAVMDVKDKTD